MNASDYGRLAPAAAAVRESLQEAIASLIRTGSAVPDNPEIYTADLRISYAEAQLLARWAAQRPEWVDPSAVDPSDPLAGELMKLAMRHLARELGVPLDVLDGMEEG